MDMDMDSMEDSKMGAAPLSNEQYAYVFLYISAALIVITAIFSWSFRFSSWSRLKSKQSNSFPAATSAWFTIVSLVREVTYVQVKLPIIGTLPSSGNLLVCVIYIAVLLSCLLSDIWSPIPVFWEAMALRSGYLAVAQTAFLIALSTKKNILGYILDTSHERLQLYHRLIGVCIVVTSTIHMGYFLREWLYYNVWASQWAEMGDSMLRWGFAAWGLLLFTLFTSISYFRHHFYEQWLTLHICTMLAFFAMLIMHLDPPYRPWAYAPLVIWAVDRLWRFISRMTLNVSFSNLAVLKAEAIIEPLEGGVTRLTVPNFAMKRSAGQYVYLSIYKLGISSHPFTIVSPTDSSDLVMILRAKGGLTRRLHTQASMHLPPNMLRLQCSIEGPYGGSQTNFRAFDVALLVAGGTGATFTMNLLRNLVADPGCCRRIIYVWAVKTRCHANWFSSMLQECKELAQRQGVDLQVQIWVTCNDELTNGSTETDASGCRSEKCQCSKKDAQILIRQDSIQEKSLEADSDISAPVGSCCCTKGKTAKQYTCYVGRPNLRKTTLSAVESAIGETGIAVCGPASLGHAMRNTVVAISDERAVKKGSGAEAIYLHVENQGF